MLSCCVTLWNRSGRMNGFRQYDFGVLAKVSLRRRRRMMVIYTLELGLFHFQLDSIDDGTAALAKPWMDVSIAATAAYK